MSMPLTKPRHSSPERDLTRVSPAERLWLWRTRQRSPRPHLRPGRLSGGLSLPEAAQLLSVGEATLSKLEAGESTLLDAGEAARVAAATGPIEPTPAELCLLARRRSGMALGREVAPAFGASKVTYLAQERAASPRVVAFWRERGYAFPPSVPRDVPGKIVEPTKEGALL